jgi:threonine dehydrogenase-like Zn-dependent dehydrogenase
VRVPLADGTLVALPVGEDHALMPSLLTLTDVMGTGHHAARAARVAPGKIAAVVGDGAVGLCGVIAARRLGAAQIIILGRHPDRIALAREFGATDVVSERGEAAVERVRELTGGLGAHSVLECVGHGASMLTAVGIARAVVPSAGWECRRKRPFPSRSPFSGTLRSPAVPHRCART